MKLAFLRLISETVLILRLLRSILPWVSLICATLMALGLGVALLGLALPKQDPRLVDSGGFLLTIGGLEMLGPLVWAIVSLRIARKLLADPDTRIKFCDDDVQLYRSAITVREQVTVHDREAESETTIRPGSYVKLPSWIMDNLQRYGITLPPPKAGREIRERPSETEPTVFALARLDSEGVLQYSALFQEENSISIRTQ
jgi:hypothetical protein